MGVEFFGGSKYLCPAAATQVHAFGFGVSVFAGKWAFGARLPEHGVFIGRESLPPFLVTERRKSTAFVTLILAFASPALLVTACFPSFIRTPDLLKSFRLQSVKLRQD